MNRAVDPQILKAKCRMIVPAVLLLLANCADLGEKSVQLLGAVPVPLRSEEPVTSEARKAQMDKVRVSFSFACAQCTLNEPVVLIFVVENGLTQPIKLDLGRDRKEAFLFTVKAPDGKRIQLPQLRREGIAVIGDLSLKPGGTYTQKILLNEWFEFALAGKYELAARLVKPIRIEEGTNVAAEAETRITLEIGPRNTDNLERVCGALARRITGSTSYQEAADAAIDLSYVKDTIAVPYLRKALLAGRLVEPIAMTGLERIGNNEAVEVLIYALKSLPHDMADLARSALARIERKTADPNLAGRIRRALNK